MSGWNRLYDKIKATDGFYTNGELMNKQAYVFLRMAKIVVNQNTMTPQGADFSPSMKDDIIAVLDRLDELENGKV